MASDTAPKLATALMASDTAEERATLAQWEFVTLPWWKRLWYWMVSIW